VQGEELLSAVEITTKSEKGRERKLGFFLSKIGAFFPVSCDIDN
jgi:hypothetical protein